MTSPSTFTHAVCDLTWNGASTKVPIARLMLWHWPFWGDTALRRRRRRRRCGPPGGRTRGSSPWCPPAFTGMTATERGVSIPTRLAKPHGGGSPLLLLLLSPRPHNARALTPYTTPQSGGGCRPVGMTAENCPRSQTGHSMLAPGQNQAIVGPLPHS